MVLAATFGVLSLLMAKIGMTRVPLVLGIILGGIIEKNLQRTSQIGGVDALHQSPLSKILMVSLVIVVALPLLREVYAQTNSVRGYL